MRLHFLPRGRISVLVVDDGRGFDKGAVLNGEQTERNIGLYGMIERTELAGGRLHIRTRQGRGECLEVDDLAGPVHDRHPADAQRVLQTLPGAGGEAVE